MSSADNRLKNPFNPPETQAGGAVGGVGGFPGFANEFQQNDGWQDHLVEEDVVDGAGAATAPATVNIATESGLYLIWAVDYDGSTISGGGGLVLFSADATTPGAIALGTAAGNNFAVQPGTTDGDLNVVVTSGVLTVVNQLGATVDVYAARLG